MPIKFLFVDIATDHILDTLPFELFIQLRANREDVTLADNHAQVWNELATLTQRDSSLFNGNTKAVEQQMSQILGLNGRVSFPVRRLGTLWRNDSWRPIITEWVRHPVGQATFNMSTFEWMSSCRMDDVSVTHSKKFCLRRCLS